MTLRNDLEVAFGGAQLRVLEKTIQTAYLRPFRLAARDGIEHGKHNGKLDGAGSADRFSFANTHRNACIQVLCVQRDGAGKSTDPHA